MKIKRKSFILAILIVVVTMIPGYVMAEEYVTSDGLNQISEIQKYLPELKHMAESIDRDLYEEKGLNNLDSCLEDAGVIPAEEVTQATKSELQSYREKFDNLYSAYYSGLVPKESFSVKVQYADIKSARAKGNNGKGYASELIFDPGTSLSAVYESIGLNPNDRNESVFIFVNGKYVFFPYWNIILNYWNGCYPSKVILHPDDDITIFRTSPETSLGAALGGDSAMIPQYINSLRQQEFTEEQYSSEAAERFTVEVKEIETALNKAGAEYSKASGLTIFASEAQEQKGGLVETTPLLANGENVVTDENGKAEIKLYDEGWILLQAVDLKDDVKGNYTYYMDDAPISEGEYHSVESGASVWVHVTETTKEEEIKEELLDELESAYNGYDRDIFPESRLKTLVSAYETAVDAIGKSETVGFAYKAQQAGINAMIKEYEGAVSDNTNNIKAFRTALGKLPDDVSLVTEGERSKMEALLSAYANMTEYQKSQLTEAELDKYDAIAALTDLPEARKYHVNVNIKADTDSATSALNDMVDWLNGEGRYYDASNSGTYGDGALINKLYTPSINRFWNDAGYAADGMVSPMETVSIMTNYNYNAWLPVLYDDLGKTYVGAKGDEYTRVEGNGWILYDTSDSDLTVYNGHVVGDITVMIGDVIYEPKSISFRGAGDVIYAESTSYREPSKYKKESGFNIYFDKPYASFDMPYNDVNIDIEWGPKESAGKPDDEDSTVRCYFTISEESEFLVGNDADSRVMARVPIDVPYVDLAEYGLEGYYRYEAYPFEAGGQYKNQVIVERPTLLMCYIKALSQYYLGREFTAADVGTGTMQVSGGATSLYLEKFWGHNFNLMYFVNHEFPLMAKGWGASCDYILLEDGDVIDVAMFTNTDFHNYGAFTYFDQDEAEISVGDELNLTLLSTGTRESSNGGSEDAGKILPEEPIRISSDYGRTWENNVYTTDESGEFTAVFDKAGVYYVSAGPEFTNQSNKQIRCFAPPIAVVKVRPKAVENGSAMRLTSSSVKVSWDPAQGADGYQVNYIDTSGTKRELQVKETECVAEGVGLGNYSFTVTPFIVSDYVAMGEDSEKLFGKTVSIKGDYRDGAIEELESAFDVTKYRKVERDAFAEILEDARNRIAAATSQEEVASIVADAKARIGKLKTDAELTKAEKELQKKISAAAAAKAKTARATVKAKALKKHKAKVTWKKVSLSYSVNGKKYTKPVTGYQVYRSLKRSKGYKKVKTITRAGTVKFTDKKLKKGKKYFYKVRTYTKINGKTYYGKWSKAKRITAK